MRVLAERVLAQIHGVDINPYAAAIARFRLVIAALSACEITKLADAPMWKIRIAIGDSLKFGVVAGQAELKGVVESALTGTAGEGEFTYEYEDAAELQEILAGQRYHAVVANPPYITVKDPILNKLYRELWWACSGKYALSVPFAQRLYDLAIPGGFTGQITSNSFMKREFGKKLIEQFFSRVDLNLVIDASGAYIPGHGTPTVIICGRKRRPVKETVRAVLGIRGEPGAPPEPAKGLVWTSIVNNFDNPGTETEYVSVIDLERDVLDRYPWSLAGGGANSLMEVVQAQTTFLEDRISYAGITAVTGADEVYVYPTEQAGKRYGARHLQSIILGDEVRNWCYAGTDTGLWLYDKEFCLDSITRRLDVLKLLYPFRAELSKRKRFGVPMLERGLTWYEWQELYPAKLQTPLTITWGEVATHNHFVLDRGGKVFKQTAPVIKLPESATEEDHLRLLGLLNSSTACFWLKQVSHSKGGSGIGRGIQPEGWMERRAFNASKLEQFPMPEGAPLELAARLDELAGELLRVRPATVAADGTPTRARLDVARDEWERIRGEMVSAQEELDWEVYGLYGLLGDDGDELIGAKVDKPLLRLGERPFEIVLARQIQAGEAESEWFTRHRSSPITELPAHWPTEYAELAERRLTKIADDPYLHLIERPECKRRWTSPPWEEMEAEALREWLLDRLEEPALWFRPGPEVRSVAQLADVLRTDAEFLSVTGLYARDADVADVISVLVRDQHVPFFSAYRYSESGMRVRAQWEKTWAEQRREDAGEKVGAIAVPPKYKQGDFRDLAYWRNRGKLDVPKERFISYPGASRDGTLLLGWAGWDHLEQAQALTGYVTERRELDAWDASRLAPLLAGLAELDQVSQDIRSALMTTGADREAFRRTYPFSPAFMETMVGLSGVLQRERTALRVMQQLLVSQRDTLELGQLVPVSDLFDALVADDEPITGELGAVWRNAQKVYGEIYRVILEGHGLTELEAGQAPASHAVRRDCRIAKTLVLAALLPEVGPMRDLTGRKIAALNYGYIRSLVPGQEGSAVIDVVRRWAARLGTVHLSGDPANPIISVRLDGISIDRVLENAEAADSEGTRRQQIRSLLCEALDAPGEGGLDGILPVTSIWRGTRRTAELAFGSIRDPADLGDAMFRPAHGGWRVVLGYPVGKPGGDVTKDLDRATALREHKPAKTVCWVPRRLTDQTIADLGRFVRLKYALGSSFDQLAGHLSEGDRAIAKQQMTTLEAQLHSTLTNALLQAYGVFTPDDAVVHTAHGGVDMFVSLQPGLIPRVPAGSSMRQALDGLLDQLLSWEYPAHPAFPSEVRKADLQKVHAQVRRAIDHPEHRIMVEAGDRPVMRKVANPLRLGEQHEQYFLLGHHWENHLGRKAADLAARQEKVTVGDLRAWLDEPQPMGLPEEIADLVILTFAEQANRSIIDDARRIDASVLQPLPAGARVVEQPLPSPEDWAQARARGQAIFGIGDVGELRTARNIGLLADRLRQHASSSLVVARQLTDLLVERGPAVLGPGTDPAATGRAKTAAGAARLCAELADTSDDKDLITLLAGFPLPAVALHVGKSLSAAADIVHAAERVDWGIYLTVAAWPPGQPLADRAGSLAEQVTGAWAADEMSAPATGLASGTSASPDSAAGSELADSGERDVDAANVGEVTAILSALASQGKCVHVSWRVRP